MHQAKTHLSRLVERAASGEEIVIGKSGKPLARLVGYNQPAAKRVLGRFRKQLHESPDAWKEELDIQIARELEGDAIVPEKAEVAERKQKFSKRKNR